MYLVDTNVWLERLLEQERSEEMKRFLAETPSAQLYITDFSLHFVGVVLRRLGRLDTFEEFLRDLFILGGVRSIGLGVEELMRLIRVSAHLSIDCDDLYQYVAATTYNLTLVRFDTDFDRTDVGRKVPAQLLQGGR
ncbi:MAG: PIN domain-containing protein [Dehalococcoidia bacterium]|nr:PIN domain-containing protein [Dehalococcoidia bacterium]MSQ17574.1 PIN domain-containing protein [Dehalococcoidia bacterium]